MISIKESKVLMFVKFRIFSNKHDVINIHYVNIYHVENGDRA